MQRKKRKKFLSRFRKTVQETEGATSVEYAVILMLIAGACITTIQTMGGATTAFWAQNRDQIEQALERD